MTIPAPLYLGIPVAIAATCVSAGCEGLIGIQSPELGEDEPSDGDASVERVDASSGGSVSSGDPDGTYRVKSEFDLLPGLEGDVGDAGHALRGLADLAEEPGEVLLERFIDLSDEIGIDPADVEPELWGPTLTLVLEDFASDTTGDLLEIGFGFSQLAQRFVLITELEVGGNSANHTLTGGMFHADGLSEEYSLAEIGLDEAVSTDVHFAVDEGGKVGIALHDLDNSYGDILLFGLENVILPQLEEGFVGSLEEFLAGGLAGECEDIADSVEQEHGETAGDIVEAGCDFGLGPIAAHIRAELRDFGGEVEDIVLSLEGVGVAQDSLGDGATDAIVDGSWDARLEVGENTVTVITESESNYSAERVD